MDRRVRLARLPFLPPAVGERRALGLAPSQKRKRLEGGRAAIRTDRGLRAPKRVRGPAQALITTNWAIDLRQLCLNDLLFFSGDDALHPPTPFRERGPSSPERSRARCLRARPPERRPSPPGPWHPRAARTSREHPQRG